MELIQIRYFIAAAQFQNLSHAARVLNITQPALTKSIAKLEDELGITLFDRTGKKVTLNERGERFLELSLKSVQELDDAASTIKNQLVTGPALYVGLFQHSERLMRCISEYSRSDPGASFQLEHLEITAGDIDTNRFDMLLYPKNAYFRRYKGEVVYSDPYLLAVHNTDPLAGRRTVRLGDLAAKKVIFIKHGNTLFDLPYNLCVCLGVRVRDSLFTNSYEIQRWLVSSGCGVGFLPQSSAAAYAADPGIALLAVAEEELRNEVMIGFKREKHLSTAGKSFAAFVRKYFNI